MLHVKDINEASEICDALGSQVRRDILGEIIRHKEINLDAIAKTLHLTNGAVTPHIKKLENAGIIKVSEVSGKRGTQKQCSVSTDKILIDVGENQRGENVFDIPVGSYYDYSVSPYCAILDKDNYIGERDNSRYFSYPERLNAGLLWFKSGILKYKLPETERGKRIKSLQISMELAAKSPGFSAAHVSQATFYLDGEKLGEFALEGEYSDRRGLLNPEWYPSGHCQYGRLRTVTVSDKGIYMDGVRLGGKTPREIKAESFALSASDGLILFGANFGDYNQSIRYTVIKE